MESFKVDHPLILKQVAHTAFKLAALYICLLYTSDAADE